jgi:hypothetical protein
VRFKQNNFFVLSNTPADERIAGYIRSNVGVGQKVETEEMFGCDIEITNLISSL